VHPGKNLGKTVTIMLHGFGKTMLNEVPVTRGSFLGQTFVFEIQKYGEHKGDYSLHRNNRNHALLFLPSSAFACR